MVIFRLSMKSFSPLLIFKCDVKFSHIEISIFLAPMMSFLASFVALKALFLGPFQFLSYHASQQPLVWIKYKMFLTLGHTMSPMFSFGCPLTLYPTPSTFNVLVPPIAWKNIHVQPTTLGVSSFPFQQSYYCLLSFCCSLLVFSF